MTSWKIKVYYYAEVSVVTSSMINSSVLLWVKKECYWVWFHHQLLLSLHYFVAKRLKPESRVMVEALNMTPDGSCLLVFTFLSNRLPWAWVSFSGPLLMHRIWQEWQDVIFKVIKYYHFYLELILSLPSSLSLSSFIWWEASSPLERTKWPEPEAHK